MNLPSTVCSTPARTRRSIALFALASLFALPGRADWAQWRGPARDGVATGIAAPAHWPETLVKRWSIEVGGGHANPLVVGDQVYVFAQRGDAELVAAYALADGKLLWEESYPHRFTPHQEAAEHGKGPFATPIVADGRLFAFGIDEVLSAFQLPADRTTAGKLLWRNDYRTQYPLSRPYYGTSFSPLVADGKLIVFVGGPDPKDAFSPDKPGTGALLALDPATGKEIWRWANDGPPYASPLVVEVDGTRQVLTQTQRAVVGVELATGKLLWRMPYVVDWDNTIITPAMIAADTFVLSAYQQPLAAYRIHRDSTGWQVASVWTNREASLSMASPLLLGGQLWAFTATKNGQIVRVDPKDGAITWRSAPGLGDHATLVAVGQLLWVLRNDAQLMVIDTAAVEGSTTQPRLIAETEVASSPTWSHPIPLADGLLIRDRSRLTRWGYSTAK